MSSQILKTISKAIKGGKYLDITYNNKNKGEITNFWICIIDVINESRLKVHIFNHTKDKPIHDAEIFIENIIKAEILKFSNYEVPNSLIKKLQQDTNFKEFGFEGYNQEVLDYLLECYKLNRDPFLYRSHLIPGIDESSLALQSPFSLAPVQLKKLIKEIYHNDYNKYHQYQLAVCELSIDLNSGKKYVVAYKKLKLDPVRETLIVDDTTSFNSSFFIENLKYSLSFYSDMAAADFQDLYLSAKIDAISTLENGLSKNEFINTRPEIIVLGYNQIDISQVFDQIQADFGAQKLEVPMRTFFQNTSSLDRKNRIDPNLVIFNKDTNFYQIQAVYNALTYPITYVQGPPGTGKTQTILNIVVNCIVNNKTLMVSSNNNVPIDGIKDKLKLGNYLGKDIDLPMIRLGNDKSVLSALSIIESWFDFESNDVPKDKMLDNLKERSRQTNQKLTQFIKDVETRDILVQNLDFVNRLLKKSYTEFLNLEKAKIEKEIKKLPEESDSKIDSLYECIQGNHFLLQFFYYESIKYKLRLQGKEFSELRAIVSIKSPESKVKKFNAWLADDKNMEKFTKVFPVIFTTNLSSKKLGSAYKFDLLVMDEAGQCDIATSLIPISKCKSMILIGDIAQLKPIIVFDESKNKLLMSKYGVDEEYDYYNNSVLSTFRNLDSVSSNILLKVHYRCGRKIINFSNQRFYQGNLELTEIRTPGALKLIDVTNNNAQNKNSNIEEALEIINYVKSNKLRDVFILTPFRNQEVVIKRLLSKAIEQNEILASVRCGTIHKLQGQESKTIIISTSISKNTNSKTYDWIKNNSQLINVGVTRAKENLIVVADKNAIDVLSKKDDDLYALIEYVSKNGEVKVPQSASTKFTIGYSNNSNFEDEFYKTMSHYCSVHSSRYDRNVKVIDLFPEEKNNPKLHKREFDGVIYEGVQPKVVFEVNGSEHYSQKKTIQSDLAKKELCEKNQIPLIAIPNEYVKHYEFIRELLNKINGAKYQKSLFDSYE